ncbi:hypothetical protein UC8_00860 [Roseimaritima ulvae]|uniref:Uncharacterized protein n=2 Tax=Roseimaritima ulvae TaxID=980254 RepID=A0A5B9QW26_9BACT|nr:hypothetical protein UC8_00860 [Roseimaritima ulvae]
MLWGATAMASDDRFGNKMRPALEVLREAAEYAADTGSDIWDFAVSIRTLENFGLNESDLRWLVKKDYVRHAREVTPPGDNGRQFRSSGDLTFCKRTCFVLTQSGASMVRAMLADKPAAVDHDGVESNGKRRSDCQELPHTNGFPHWDSERRILYVDKRIVKRFKWRATNQEAVLSTFQEEGWPPRVDDPLPPHPEQDSKRRLSDTIKCLNHKQANDLIRFHGDGTGEGVTWERTDT